MSRIGNKPVVIPSGVKVAVDGQNVAVEGPKGKLQQTFRPEVKIALDGSKKKSVPDTCRFAHSDSMFDLSALVSASSLFSVSWSALRT